MTSTTRIATLLLLPALGLAPACGNLDGPPPVESIAYDADGSLLTFMAFGIHVFNTTLDRETRTIPFDGLPVTRTFEVYRYSVSADGRKAAVSFPAPEHAEGTMSDPSTIALFDLTTGDRLNTFHPDDPAPYGRAQGVVALKVSPNADLVSSCSINADPSIPPPDWGYRLTVFDAATGQAVWTKDFQQAQVPGFSPDGTMVFIQGDAPQRLEALDARTGASLYAIDLPGRLQALTMTYDGRLAGLIGTPVDQPCPEPGSCPPSIAFWSSTDGTLLEERPGTAGIEPGNTNASGGAFWCSPWTDLCATELIDFNKPTPTPVVLTLWRTDGTAVQTIDLSSGINVLTFSPDGQYVADVGFVGSSDAVRVFRISDGKVVGQLNFDWSLL